MAIYKPEERYASTDTIKLDLLIAEEFFDTLVEPRNPALHRRANVDPFSSDVNWKQKEKEMLQIMREHFGIGLAAPQLGAGYNMFVMRHKHLGEIGVYNPKILETKGEVQIEEGCLTWPALYIPIKRPEKIKVTYTKTDGKTQVETWMDGIDARCFLHEYDHLHGVNFIDLVSEFKLKRAKQKRDNYLKKAQRKLR